MPDEFSNLEPFIGAISLGTSGDGYEIDNVVVTDAEALCKCSKSSRELKFIKQQPSRFVGNPYA